MMHLFKIYGEDDPHRGDGAPFKVYLIYAPDEAMARRITPDDFTIDRIEIAKSYPDANDNPHRWGWIGGEHPLLSGGGDD